MTSFAASEAENTGRAVLPQKMLLEVRPAAGWSNRQMPRRDILFNQS